ncbi:MAG: phytanoyl-CoA dioxygenase family protein, partial [Myxococcota bacterium]
MGEHFFLVKSIYFDKRKERNWYVNWHQDRSINVKEKGTYPGYSGWTAKEDYHGVLPPVSLSKNIVTLRVHLDDCAAEQGALQLLPNTHERHYDDTAIAHLAKEATPVSCTVNKGDVLLMKPLTLHSSPENSTQRRRRVLHLEFSNQDLPQGLEWAEKELVH